MIAHGALVVWLVAAGWTQPNEPPPWRHDVSGLFRSLFAVSRSYQTRERYVDSVNRLRVAAAGGRGDAFSYRIEIDSETHLGAYVSTPEFAYVRGRQQRAWLDLLHVVSDEPRAYSDLSVYRGAVSFRSAEATLTLGRQRIAWGTARFWSPADLFNPIDPLQVEGDVRQGVDAVQVDWASGGSPRMSMVYAPNASGRSVAAGRVGGTAGVWDLAAFAGWFRHDWVAGGEVAGQWGGAGLRGELTYHWRGDDVSRDALRVAAGWDYAFPKLYLVAEYFYNQGQPPCGVETVCEALTAPTAELFTRHRHFISGGARYDVTPLLEANGSIVVDVAGSSVLVYPTVRYNVSANVDVSAGGQFFVAARGGEFDQAPALFFARIDVHF